MTISWVLHVSLAIGISSLRLNNNNFNRVSVTPLDDHEDYSPFDVAEHDAALREALHYQIAHKSFVDQEAESGKENLCIDGRLAPELYLIGQAKAATCSFSAMLGHPQIVRPKVFADEPAYYWKELHFFDTPARFNNGKEFWLSHFPKCTTDTRQVATDLTPFYFNNKEVPKRIQEMYGEQAHRLKFAAILRNPAQRIQTVYHFTQKQGMEEWRCKHANDGFKAYVEKMVSTGEDPCNYKQGNAYERSLKKWLPYFNSSQFMLIPYQEIVAPKNGHSKAIQAVWKSVGIDGKAPKVAHVNGNAHPSLLDELGPTLLKQYEDHVRDTRGIRPRELAQSIVDNNIKLFGYEKSKSDVDEVLKYLENSW